MTGTHQLAIYCIAYRVQAYTAIWAGAAGSYLNAHVQQFDSSLRPGNAAKSWHVGLFGWTAQQQWLSLQTLSTASRQQQLQLRPGGVLLN